MKITAILLTSLAGVLLSSALPAQAPEDYVAGPFSSSRLRIGEFLDDIDLQQWRMTLIIGYSAGGYPWRGFVRMGVDQAYGLGNDTFISLNKLEQATKITWTTGIVWKQDTNAVYSADGGADVGVYFVPDLTVQEGSTPTWLQYTFEDYPGAVKVGDIARETPFTNPEANWGTESLAREHMTIEIDITQAVKDALSAGQITSGKSFAMGLLQTEFDDFDPAEIPVGFADLGRMTILAAEQSFFTLSFDEQPVDYGPFNDYPIEDFYADTGAWLGWVYLKHYPWVYVSELGAYVYSGGDAWIFISK
ncbi:MAG: hypothetical protein ACP5I4_11680 [Oceanipulchritudo sp.]